jgi:tRNA pseudouridine32 synthase/23S rRNA pseudouridine746 synthase
MTWIYSPPTAPLVVLHHDRDLVVVDKPSGLLSIPGREPGHEDSALSRVRKDWPTAADVHRLDLDTSGVLVFATRGKAVAAMMEAFRERKARKGYLAWVAGVVQADKGVIDAALSHVDGPEPRSVVDPQGRPSRTRFRVRERRDDRTLVELFPETGRSHQLRVHLLSIGHPILGDRFYAPPDALAAAPRLMLHAAWLEVPHPYRKTMIRFEAPSPFG